MATFLDCVDADVFKQLDAWYRARLSEGEPECFRSFRQDDYRRSRNVIHFENADKILNHSVHLAATAYFFDGPDAAAQIIRNAFNLLNGCKIEGTFWNGWGEQTNKCVCMYAECLVRFANKLGLNRVAEQICQGTVCEGALERIHATAETRKPQEIKEYLATALERAAAHAGIKLPENT